MKSGNIYKFCNTVENEHGKLNSLTKIRKLVDFTITCNKLGSYNVGTLSTRRYWKNRDIVLTISKCFLMICVEMMTIGLDWLFSYSWVRPFLLSDDGCSSLQSQEYDYFPFEREGQISVWLRTGALTVIDADVLFLARGTVIWNSQLALYIVKSQREEDRTFLFNFLN